MSLQPLIALRAAGMVPHDNQIWLGLGIRPPKANAVEIDPAHLPTDDECTAVAGLDVLLTFCGFIMPYKTLRTLCGSLYQARPCRLQLYDLDYKKTAFLKLGGRA